MNERIREFAEQCVGSRPYNTFDYEKFAELIVRECADVADKGVAKFTMKPEWPSYYINKHFGIKE